VILVPEDSTNFDSVENLQVAKSLNSLSDLLN